MLKEVTGFRGRLRYDRSKPDGTPCKRLDVSRLTRLGWQARIDLRRGLEDTYRWFLATPEAAVPSDLAPDGGAGGVPGTCTPTVSGTRGRA